MSQNDSVRSESAAPEFDARRAAPSRRRKLAGRGLLFFGAILIGSIAAMPAPYVIERPGPVFNILGDKPDSSLVSISGAKTYPADGNLNLMTVSMVGSPRQTPSWFELISAWMDPAQTIVPLEEAFPNGQTAQENEVESQKMMAVSQQDAIAAALNGLGLDFGRQIYVELVSKSTPASGKLVAGDIVQGVNGKPAATIDELRSLIQKSNGSEITIQVSRDGKPLELKVTPFKDDDGAYRMGVLTSYVYDFPIDVKIKVEDVGGPSGGLMFALAITELLGQDSLNHGLDISGTGTITPEGQVGPIGGIQQKMYAAIRAGSKYFLAPAENCPEVVGHVPSGLNVFKVSTLTEAKQILAKLGSGIDPSTLPTCTAQSTN
jgi:PDZ domain-containing protein